jgi:hypothetical protein
MTPSRIEPATFRLVAQCLNQVHHRVPPLTIRYFDKMRLHLKCDQITTPVNIQVTGKGQSNKRHSLPHRKWSVLHITKANQFNVVYGSNPVYCRNNKKPINKLCGQNAELLVSVQEWAVTVILEPKKTNCQFPTILPHLKVVSVQLEHMTANTARITTWW